MMSLTSMTPTLRATWPLKRVGTSSIFDLKDWQMLSYAQPVIVRRTFF